MPPTMPMVLALSVACDELVFVSPIAAPAALRIAVSSVATPTATSQPKNAAPQFRPPNSSRWSAPRLAHRVRRPAAGGRGRHQRADRAAAGSISPLPPPVRCCASALTRSASRSRALLAGLACRP